MKKSPATESTTTQNVYVVMTQLFPDGQAYSHNIMPLYGLECARRAALELGQSEDASWLSKEKEYADYKDAIMASIEKADPGDRKPRVSTCHADLP